MRLSLRLALIVAVAFTLIVCVLFFAVVAIQRPARSFGVILPRPSQVAAMVALIDKTPAADRGLATDALSAPYLTVRVLNGAPSSKGGLAMPGVALALRAYQLALPGRTVSVMAELDRDTDAPDIVIGREQVRATRPVRILASLADGKILMVEARRPLSERFTGVRLGFLALFITLVIGAISLWMIRRQLKPLERLAVAVERFGTTLETSKLPEEGTVELRQVIAAFNRLEANIGDLVNGRTQMITAVGHDIGTYLTRLRLRVELIADDEQRAKSIRDIDDMHALMRETLSLAKLEHDNASAEAVDAGAVAKRMAAGFAELGENVICDAGAEPVLIWAAGLERALSNLIANAVKYGGEAIVQVRRSGDDVCLTVEDRGPGIPAEQREAVLQPFYRLDTARNLNERGFGLGLAITAAVVRAGKGSLTFEDREGGGLRVRMIFPAAQA